MQIIMKRLEEIIPYEKNPRKNDDAVEYVKNSIKEFGFKVPIVIDKDNIIVAGHTRYKASKELQLKEVPCIIADDLTKEQIKAFRIADNKVSEKAQWDFNLLDEELCDIKIDMSQFGFELDNFKDYEDTMVKESLKERFIIPPFSIFDTRQGYWQDRKRKWIELGIKSEVGRNDNLLGFSNLVKLGLGGTSIFDPVLCEICYKWFNIPTRTAYRCGNITRNEAMKELKPYIEEYNKFIVELSKKYNRKPKLFSFNAFMR